ncbi:unnamed protein product [Moneuplotes crassus]|uniref:Uncharacterized protein n=1 Tax=Euplotes crassus TaxID=5936 RepID=A0AAD1XLT3_EUPCR|nr:unnamed protein product [Moneuplotes crassus]
MPDNIIQGREKLFLMGGVIVSLINIYTLNFGVDSVFDSIEPILAFPFYAYLALMMYATLVVTMKIDAFRTLANEVSRYTTIWLLLVFIAHLLPGFDVRDYIGEHGITQWRSFAPFYFLLSYLFYVYHTSIINSDTQIINEHHITYNPEGDSESLTNPLSIPVPAQFSKPSREDLVNQLMDARAANALGTILSIIFLYFFTTAETDYLLQLSASGILFTTFFILFMYNFLYLLIKQTLLAEDIEKVTRVSEEAVASIITILGTIAAGLEEDSEVRIPLILFLGCLIQVLMVNYVLRSELALRDFDNANNGQIKKEIQSQQIFITLDKKLISQ